MTETHRTGPLAPDLYGTVTFAAKSGDANGTSSTSGTICSSMIPFASFGSIEGGQEPRASSNRTAGA